MTTNNNNGSNRPPETQPALEPGSYIGQVTEIDSHGKIKTVLTEEGKVVQVTDQSSSVPKAPLHASCIIVQIGQQTLITHLLLGEKPPYSLTVEDGKLLLEANSGHDGLIIRTGRTQLELTSDGQVQLQGQNIHVEATDNLTFVGHPINLNHSN